jgi:hypothetical protein
MRTIQEIQEDIQRIISKSKSNYDLQNALQTAGYPVTYTWIKGNGIGKPFYLKRKKIYRIQVSPGQLCGKYCKAYCVEIYEPALQQNLIVT